MDNIKLNAELWGKYYDWAGKGEEWSEMWGGSRAQWLGSIYPRVSAFLPARSLLEIAPGYGRWTQYLLSACRQYHGIDLSQDCIDACRRRFSEAKHASFSTNDGISLSRIRDASVDFVFSFDSLVHATADVMSAYIAEILRVLHSGGVAFIHHSNLLEVASHVDKNHGRGFDVSADTVRRLVADAGGVVLIQEKINWGEQECTDCLSLFSNRGPSESVMIENHDFMLEAVNIRKHQSYYTRADLLVKEG